MRRSLLPGTLAALIALLVSSLAPPAAFAGEWTSWRGPAQDGTSPETGLVNSWSKEGENLIWHQPITARSTPVVFDGRACTTGRVGEDDDRVELVACFDAEDGSKLWEYRHKVFLTTIPWNRVGWSSLAADPETGNVYALGVRGTFLALGPEGDVVWERDLAGELGFYSGYGGRTPTPTVDEDRVYLAASNGGWGPFARLVNRVFAFDKHSGELLWATAPGGAAADPNTQIAPVVTVVDGRRLVINGNGDGNIYALDARTGAKVWEFKLSKRGINTDVVVDEEGIVYASHSEENVDSAVMGRVVAFSAKGEGDITKTNEKWRADLAVGFSSPALADGTLYMLTNSASLLAVDAGSGKLKWEKDLGTVGKSSPVVADGKLYATEVNGLFHILKLGPEGAEALDRDEISVPDGSRYAEIYGSPAIAYGRVYFTTEEGIYCLGDAKKPFPGSEAGTRDGSGAPWPVQEAAPAGAEAAQLLAVPGDSWITPSETVDLRALAFTAKGLSLGEKKAQWSLDGLQGTVSADGVFTPDPKAGAQHGAVKATLGAATASAYVKVVPPPPFEDDLEGAKVGDRAPSYFSGALIRFGVEELEGNKVISKGPSPSGIHKHRTFFGAPDWKSYTFQADLLGTRSGRKVPDMGLVAGGYTVDMMGAYQKVQIRFWDAEPETWTETPFEWETGRWYTMKVRVDNGADKAVVKAKVWPRDEEEPAQWLITMEDNIPVPAGAPGLYGYSPAPVYYDNLSVVPN